MASSPSTSWMPGALVGGRYHILRRLTGGGMGEIFEARDTQRDIPVALKRMVIEKGGGSTLERERRIHEAATRLEREVRFTSRLGHPGIVQVYDLVYDADGTPVMVMELLQGITLQDHLAFSTLPVPVALDWMAQVLDALAAAHDAGVVHRDLKPANLYLVEDPEMPLGVRVKILDFGVARQVSTEANDDDEQATALTMANSFLGSYQYASPEQFDPTKTVTPRSDLYAVGIILFRALVGRHPANTRTLHDLMMRTLFGNLERAARPHRPDVPHRLDAALARALALHPEERFPDARAMRDALLEAAADFAHGATPSFAPPVPAAPAAPFSAPPPTPLPAPLQASPPALATPPRRAPWIPLALGLLAATGWGLWALTRFGPP